MSTTFNLASLGQYAVTLVLVAAVTTLAAIGKVSGNEALVIIGTFGGVHIGTAATAASASAAAASSSTPPAA